MAYDLDFRTHTVSLLSAGHSLSFVSQLLCVGTATLVRWKARASHDNLAAHYPKTRGSYKIDDTALQAYIAQHPDACLQEIADAIGSRPSSISDALKRLGITRKKRRHSIAKGMRKSVAFIGNA